MNPEDAAVIVSLRPAIENMISLASENPEGFFPLNPENEKLVNLIRDLSRLETAKFGEEVRAPRGNHGNSYGGGYQQQREHPGSYNDAEGDAPDGEEYNDSFGGSEDYE